MVTYIRRNVKKVNRQKMLIAIA